MGGGPCRAGPAGSWRWFYFVIENGEGKASPWAETCARGGMGSFCPFVIILKPLSDWIAVCTCHFLFLKELMYK